MIGEVGLDGKKTEVARRRVLEVNKDSLQALPVKGFDI